MAENLLRELLEDVAAGHLEVNQAVKRLKDLPYENLSFARVDHHRVFRSGIPEVVFSEGKKPEDVVSIARALHRTNGRVIITRATGDIRRRLRIRGALFHERSGVITAGRTKRPAGSVLVISAGTADIPVAEEAAVTASFLGSRVKTVFDVGVAGIHRVIDQRESFGTSNAIIVVAGMEGALPSVVGGLTDRPIVAVPTSTGYGTSFGGVAALLAMLNSCVPGVAVVNIDNGFGAGCLAHKINVLAAIRR